LKLIIECFSLPQGHPRCRCVCFHSIFNFDIFWSNRCCLSGGPPQRAWTESMSKLNMI